MQDRAVRLVTKEIIKLRWSAFYCLKEDKNIILNDEVKQQPILLRIGFHIEVVDDVRYSGTSVVKNINDFLARKSSLRPSHIHRFFHGCFRGTINSL